MNSTSAALEAGSKLKKTGLTLSVAESCTGGLLSKLLTDISGSSEYYLGGVISYSNEVKINLLGVSPETLEKYGAVSADTAREMAEGVRKALKTEISLAVTGIAGPGGGSTEKPVGTVFIALSRTGKDTLLKELRLKGTREEIRGQSAEAALRLLLESIKDMDE